LRTLSKSVSLQAKHLKTSQKYKGGSQRPIKNRTSVILCKRKLNLGHVTQQHPGDQTCRRLPSCSPKLWSQKDVYSCKATPHTTEKQSAWSESQKITVLDSQNLWISLKERWALQITFPKEMLDIKLLVLIGIVNQHLGSADYSPLN